ncbi:HEAT repeat domain-containing protein [Halorientalis salina]|uniref:HEAT repeat domain-containing protein n=1 Tax=Halorientalis salina TaxID=2932266 RepID=UPI0010AC9FE7|nr:HEAT repeat domain-containing protein [Halorientalis salina]
MPSSLPFEALLSGTPEEREAAAQSLSEVATATPARLYGSLARLTDGLADDHEPVRRAVANALFEVAVDDPTAVGPVAEALVDALADESVPVRMGAARSLAELAAVRPQRLRFAVADLLPSLTDDERVRENVAWALASLAPRYPEVIHEHVDAITRSLLDEHPPVQRFVLETLVPLERTDPGLLDVVSQRLQELAASEEPGVRQSACRAIAANDPPWARRVLRECCRTDAHPVVRETARGALTVVEAAGPSLVDRDLSTAEHVFTHATLDTWVAVRTDRDDEGPFLVGSVTAIAHATGEADEAAMAARGLRRADFDSHRAWLAGPRIDPSGERTAVHLHNPDRNYGVTLLIVSDGIGAEYTDPDRDVPSLHRPESVYACPADCARLLAAQPGDTLAFEIEGADHEIVLTTAGDDDGTYRVAGRNHERGYEISFRPLGQNPMMAVFEKGRAFRARNLRLTAPG